MGHDFTDVIKSSLKVAKATGAEIVDVKVPMRIVQVGKDGLFPIQIMERKNVKGWLYDNVHIIVFETDKGYIGVNRKSLRKYIEALITENGKQFSEKPEVGKLISGISGDIITFIQHFTNEASPDFIFDK